MGDNNMKKPMMLMLLAAVSAISAAKDTDPSTREGGITRSEAHDRQIRNESYERGRKDGYESGKKDGAAAEKGAAAAEKLLGEIRKGKGGGRGRAGRRAGL